MTQDATTTLICVPPADVPKVWPMVADMIDAAYAESDEIMPDVQAWLLDGKGLLWIAVRDGAIKAALTSSLVPMRSGLVCRMVAVGGGALDLWRDHIETLVAHARAEGCVKVVCDGRPGWARAIPGFSVKAVSLEKVI